MTEYVDISLDKETWGKRAGFDIRSIGACRFNPLTGKVSLPGDDDGFTFYQATENPLGGFYSEDHYTQIDLDKIYGPGSRLWNLRRDPKTVEWWHEQGSDAQAAFKNPIDLKATLVFFTRWLHMQSNDIRDGQAHDIRLWSHGAAFDPPILEAIYHVVGLPVPWFYRAPRDTRTAFDMAGIDDHSALLKHHKYGVSHHALDDSITQARAICEAFSIADGYKRGSVWLTDKGLIDEKDTHIIRS